MGKTPPGHCGNRAFLFARERLLGASGQRGMVEPQRVTNQNPRIKVWRSDAVGTKLGGPSAPASGYRERC